MKTAKLVTGGVVVLAVLTFLWLTWRGDHARPPAKAAAVAPLKAIVDAAGDDPESLVAARAMAIDAIGIAAAQIGPIGYTACAHATPANTNIWQQCIAMVDLLEHRSDTLMARGVGAAIDRRLTGDAEPGKRVSAQMGHLLSLELASTSSCNDLRIKLSIMRRLGIEGDAAFAQDLAP